MNNRLNEIERFAIHNVDKYKDLANLKLEHNIFPILTKKEVQSEPNALLSDKYRNVLYQTLLSMSTSGSSGMPLEIFWDIKDYHRSMLDLWRLRKSWYGITPNMKCLSFSVYNGSLSGDEKYVLFEKNKMLVNRKVFGNYDRFSKVLDLIESYNPDWLYIQPLLLNMLIDNLEKSGFNPLKNIKYIETVGEVRTEALQKKARNFFNVPIVNLYGSEEMNGIAYECPYHNLHVISSNVYVECYNDKGILSHGVGRAIITNLHNYAMPLIRYDQGDIIELSDNQQCKCGCYGKIIENVFGRTNSILNIDGVDHTPYEFNEIIYKVNGVFDNIITNYRFEIKKSTSHIYIYVGLKKNHGGWKNEVFKSIEGNVTEHELN